MFGVAREGVSFVDLLGAGLLPVTEVETAGWVADRFGVRLAGDPRAGRPRRRSRCAATRAARTCWCLRCSASTCRPTRATCTAPGCGSAGACGPALGDGDAVVLGFAETATGLGHCVAEALAAAYLHSTRRDGSGRRAVRRLRGGAQPRAQPPAAARRPGPACRWRRARARRRRAVHRAHRAQHDRRPARRRAAPPLRARRARRPARARPTATTLAAFAAELGARIDVVALARGAVSWPDDFPARAAQAVNATDPPPPAAAAGDVVRCGDVWPAGVRESGRHGFGPPDVAAARAAAGAVAAAVAPALTAPHARPRHRGADVRADARGAGTRRARHRRAGVRDHPLAGARRRRARATRSARRCTSRARPASRRFAYNVAGFADVVLVTDEPPESLVAALRGVCERVHVVVLPCRGPASDGPSAALPPALRGPDFGSYPADAVGWLLTDLSAVPLEAPVEEREEAVQSGGAHYAESLPIEYQPDAEYRRLFEQALEGAAERVAHAVGVVTELDPRRARPGTGARLAGPGRHAGRDPAAPLGALRARTRSAALHAEHRARPRHRRRSRCATSPSTTTRPRSCSSTAGPARAPSPARLAAALAGTPFDPRTGGARRPGLLRDDLRHPRGFPHPVRLPELDRLRARLAHGAEPPHPRARPVPRREVLPRTRRRRRLQPLPGRDLRPLRRRRRPGRRGLAGAAGRRPRADLGRLGRGRGDQRGVRHRRRHAREARGRGDDPGAAAPGAVAGAGPPGRGRRAGARPAARRAPRRAGARGARG